MAMSSPLPGQFRPTAAMDVQIELLSSAERPLAHNSTLDLYLGAAETPVRVLLLDADEIKPGETGWAQLRLARPLVAAWSDRFILRAPSPSETIGGGSVVEPWARRHKRRDPATLARLGNWRRAIPRRLSWRRCCQRNAPARVRQASADARRRRSRGRPGWARRTSTAALAVLVERRQVTQVGPFYYATARWERLRAASAALLRAYHQQYPLRRGLPREEWRARLGLSPREAHEVISALLALGELAEGAETERTGQGRSGLLRLPEHTPRFTPEQERAVASLLRAFHAQPFSPPTRAEAEQAIGARSRRPALVERGDLLRMNAEILLERAAYQEAVRRIVAHLRAHGRISVAEGRDLLTTSRKYMLAIFERLDERRITLRDGDERILGPGATLAAEVEAENGEEN